MVKNLFDCLCCLLMPLENKERFVKAEGVELMIIIMKQKKLAYGSIIDHCRYWSSLVFREYHDNIGDLDGLDEKERAQAKIQKFISAL